MAHGLKLSSNSATQLSCKYVKLNSFAVFWNAESIFG